MRSPDACGWTEVDIALASPALGSLAITAAADATIAYVSTFAVQFIGFQGPHTVAAFVMFAFKKTYSIKAAFSLRMR